MGICKKIELLFLILKKCIYIVIKFSLVIVNMNVIIEDSLGPMTLEELDVPMTLEELDVPITLSDLDVPMTLTELDVPGPVCKRCCSFCREPGHNYTRCDHPSVAKLEKKMQDIHVINAIFLIEPQYIQLCLKELTLPELKMLAHKKNIKIPKSRVQDHTYYVNALYLQAYYIDTDSKSKLFHKRITVNVKEHFDAMSDELVESYLEHIASCWPRIGSVVFRHFYNSVRETRKHHVLFTTLKSNGLPNPWYLSVLEPPKLAEKSGEDAVECCAICLETMNSQKIVLNCGHPFCADCIKQNFKHLDEHEDMELTCAICRSVVLALSCGQKSTSDYLDRKYGGLPYEEKRNLEWEMESRRETLKKEKKAKEMSALIEKNDRELTEWMTVRRMLWLKVYYDSFKNMTDEKKYRLVFAIFGSTVFSLYIYGMLMIFG